MCCRGSCVRVSVWVGCSELHVMCRVGGLRHEALTSQPPPSRHNTIHHQPAIPTHRMHALQYVRDVVHDRHDPSLAACSGLASLVLLLPPCFAPRVGQWGVEQAAPPQAVADDAPAGSASLLLREQPRPSLLCECACVDGGGVSPAFTLNRAAGPESESPQFGRNERRLRCWVGSHWVNPFAPPPRTIPRSVFWLTHTDSRLLAGAAVGMHVWDGRGGTTHAHTQAFD